MCTFRVVPRMYIYIYILGLYTMCIFVLKVTYACCANLAGLFPLLVFAAGLNKVLEYKQFSRSDIALCATDPFQKPRLAWLWPR